MGCVSATGVHLASALLLANHACFVWTQRGNWATATAAAEPALAGDDDDDDDDGEDKI